MSLRISAVIPTHNRAPYLRKAIHSLVNQSLASEEYEILVIDNASTDDTRRVVTQEHSAVTNLRYFYEPILGSNQARDTGWRNATGKYVAYLDDDAIACRDWLEKILRVFETVRPTPGCLGGKVEPIWEAPRPAWLPERLITFLAVLDYSDVPGIMKSPFYLMGANMAFPKEALEFIGGFYLGLGLKGSRTRLYNDDIAPQQQLEKAGYTLYYDPAIVVSHHIPAARLTQKYFLRRMYWQGVSEAVLLMHGKRLSMNERARMALDIFWRNLLVPRTLINLFLPGTKPARVDQKCSTFRDVGWVVTVLGLTNYS